MNTMDLNLTTVVVLITIVLTGLTAGLCFTWGNAVTPGIGQLDDLGFLQAFQQMNRAIINPTFLVVFFGPFLGHVATIYLNYQRAESGFWYFVIAGAIFLLGLVFVTVFRNVPLNELLDQTDLATASADDLKALRRQFETPWNRWHLVRTFSSLASFALMLIGLTINR